jgi:hypothetical protein
VLPLRRRLLGLGSLVAREMDATAW